MKRPAPTPSTVAQSVCGTDGAPVLLLLTGARGAGKTRWCTTLLHAARKEGLAVAGLLSPPVYEKGRKTAINLLDIATNKQRCLAERTAPGEAGTAGLGWRFKPATLNWGNAVLKGISRCDLLILDELGPLEFDGKGGLNAAFSLIDAADFRTAIIVVRPELLQSASKRWPWIAHIYEVTKET